MVVGQDSQQLLADKIWVTCESLTKIIKNHQNSLKRLLLDRSRRGEAGGPNESSRGLGLARLLTSPHVLKLEKNCQKVPPWSLSLKIPKIQKMTKNH